MFARNRSIPRIAATIVVAAGLAMGSALPAFASDGTEVVVTAGELSMSNPAVSNFTGVEVTGADQTTTATLASFTVSDLTGSGAGWHVTAQATQFDGPNHDLAAASLSMSKPSVAQTGTTSAVPTVENGPYIIDNGSAVEIASAAVDTGMGVYTFGATTLTLSLPANVYAETYSSTVTLSVVTAP